KLIALVSAEGRTPQQRALDQTAMYSVMKSLDSAIEHISNVRGGVGARLAVLDDADAQLDARETQLKLAQADTSGVDMIDAAIKMTQSQTALQAAQQSYMRVQGLSLFDYLR